MNVLSCVSASGYSMIAMVISDPWVLPSLHLLLFLIVLLKMFFFIILVCIYMYIVHNIVARKLGVMQVVTTDTTYLS